MYGSVFAIEDFAASVGFAFGTYPKSNAYWKIHPTLELSYISLVKNRSHAKQVAKDVTYLTLDERIFSCILFIPPNQKVFPKIKLILSFCLFVTGPLLGGVVVAKGSFPW